MSYQNNLTQISKDDAYYVWYNGLPDDYNDVSWFCFPCKLKKDPVLDIYFDPTQLKVSWHSYMELEPTKFLEKLIKLKDEDPGKVKEIVNAKEYMVLNGTMGHAVTILAGELPEYSYLHLNDITNNRCECNDIFGIRRKHLHQDKAIEILQFLIECGLDLSIKNSDDKTAYELLIEDKDNKFKRINNEKFREFMKQKSVHEGLGAQLPEYVIDPLPDYNELYPLLGH